MGILKQEYTVKYSRKNTFTYLKKASYSYLLPFNDIFRQKIMKENEGISSHVSMCLVTHPHSLHLGPERIQQLEQDQSQRVDVHFMRVRVSREL